ncbi:MAG: DUF5667 domain-containing protein [Bacillota bacterium]
MKNSGKLLSIALSTALAVTTPGLTWAAENVSSPPVIQQSAEAGVTPDSWLYPLERFLEQLQLAITFSEQAKAELLATLAQERMAEAETMQAAGKYDLAVKATADLVTTVQTLENMQTQLPAEVATTISPKIQEVKQQSVDTLNQVLAKTPDEARDNLEDVKDRLELIKEFVSSHKELQQAKQEVKAAEKALNEAINTSNPEAIEKAQENLQETQDKLNEATEKQAEAKEEMKEKTKKETEKEKKKEKDSLNDEDENKLETDTTIETKTEILTETANQKDDKEEKNGENNNDDTQKEYNEEESNR